MVTGMLATVELSARRNVAVTVCGRPTRFVAVAGTAAQLGCTAVQLLVALQVTACPSTVALNSMVSVPPWVAPTYENGTWPLPLVVPLEFISGLLAPEMWMVTGTPTANEPSPRRKVAVSACAVPAGFVAADGFTVHDGMVAIQVFVA